MRRSVRRAAIAATIAAGLAGGLAGTAFAATGGTTTAAGGTTLAKIKARSSTDIAARLSSLNTAISAVNSNQVISSSDKSTLLNTLNGDLTGLTALGPKIQADTTVALAATDYKTIFSAYRVYALALPQVRYAGAVDDITTGVLPRLTDAHSKLSALLAGSASGKNTPAVQAAMTDLADQIQAITSTTNGLSSQALALTPAQYDANHAILSGPRQSLVTARGDIKTARQDVKTVVAAIK
jgi:hypothetical protein